VGTPGGPTGDGDIEAGLDRLDADLAVLIGDAHAVAATEARIRERHLRDAAAGDATLLGVLLDVAERRQPVSLRSRSGRTVQGWVVVVASDAVVVEGGGGLLTYLRVASLATVRPATGPLAPKSGRSDEAGNRRPPRATSFAALIADLAADRPRVALDVEGEGGLLTGELRSVGVDLLRLRLDGDPPVTTHVALAQLSGLAVLASG